MALVSDQVAVDRDLDELRGLVDRREGLDLVLVPGLLEALGYLLDVLGPGELVELVLGQEVQRESLQPPEPRTVGGLRLSSLLPEDGCAGLLFVVAEDLLEGEVQLQRPVVGFGLEPADAVQVG